MKKKNERNARKEEARKELKPEVQDGVKLTDEQMEQVSGGAGPEIKLDFDDVIPVAPINLKSLYK